MTGIPKFETHKSIFLVDDDEDDRMLIKEALEQVMHDVNIIEVNDGIELLELMDRSANLHEPALIVMDMNMPRMSGLEALSVIRTSSQLRHVPIVMLSTSSNEDLIFKAYRQGINAYITKPVTYHAYSKLAEAISVSFLNTYPLQEEVALPENLSGKNILIVEDSDDHWELMNITLRQILPDVHITRFSDDATAREYLRDNIDVSPFPIDMIILDLYLPTRQQGLDLLSTMKNSVSDARLPFVPVVVFSFSDNPVDIRESYSHQANAFVMKGKNLRESMQLFRQLCDFWWNTISSPARF
ncbi:response regulator [Dyadobacter crusticola]|uniref:response regulator n=1 Tax=Dyadobacter crusticola TaxID=292407 RepID=UPI00069068FF|nr:response regulator [Dyadobacter crusticola]